MNGARAVCAALSSQFLDVDDLKEGKGAEYVDASCLILVFVSDGYIKSPNCMRELLRAVVTQKPIMALVELETKHGALTRAQVQERLQEADDLYESWGMAAEVRSWGYQLPDAAKLEGALWQAETIEWNRIGAFQDVSMRLIAQRLDSSCRLFKRMTRAQQGNAELDSSTSHAGKQSPSSKRSRSKEAVYVQGELIQKEVVLHAPSPPYAFHAFCSAHNLGSSDLMAEVGLELGIEVITTDDPRELKRCERVLVYLTSATWTSGWQSEAFCAEVTQAMLLGVPLLLCHEMPGLGRHRDRGGCEFGTFFSTTPMPLLQANLYSQIATPLKEGAWRAASMVMVGCALAEKVGERKPVLGILEGGPEAEAASYHALGSVDVAHAGCGQWSIRRRMVILAGGACGLARRMGAPPAPVLPHASPSASSGCSAAAAQTPSSVDDDGTVAAATTVEMAVVRQPMSRPKSPEVWIARSGQCRPAISTAIPHEGVQPQSVQPHSSAPLHELLLSDVDDVDSPSVGRISVSTQTAQELYPTATLRHFVPPGRPVRSPPRLFKAPQLPHDLKKFLNDRGWELKALRVMCLGRNVDVAPSDTNEDLLKKLAEASM